MKASIPKLRAPVILVHGLFGFARMGVAGFTVVNYFPGITDAIHKAGNRVLTPSLSPTAGIAARALQLKEFILRESPAEPVHILAHSMGGLDSRYMISRMDMAEKVLSLTTLGTPHRGTPFADWAVGRLERLVRPLFNLLDVPTQGFYDLTLVGCRTFNEQVANADGVRYFSVAAQHDGNFVNWEWLLPYYIVWNHEGANDGVVSVASAQWGEQSDVWDGDHFSLVNWYHPWSRNRGMFRDPIPRYGGLLQRLADLGF